jgi:hypothetical protein
LFLRHASVAGLGGMGGLGRLSGLGGRGVDGGSVGLGRSLTQGLGMLHVCACLFLRFFLGLGSVRAVLPVFDLVLLLGVRSFFDRGTQVGRSASSS